MRAQRIAVLAGDGIGPEVVDEALRVLKAPPFDRLSLEFADALIGGAALDVHDDPLPAQSRLY